MANFITSTVIWQADAGSPGNSVPLVPPTRLRTLTGYYATMAEAMAQVPQGQRPAANLYGAYFLEYRPTAYVLLSVRGIVVGMPRLLLLFTDLWPSKAAHDAAPAAPVLRNSFLQQYQGDTQAAGRNMGAELLAALDRYLVTASIRNASGDERDLRTVASTDPANDPLGILQDPTIQAADGAARTYSG